MDLRANYIRFYALNQALVHRLKPTLHTDYIWSTASNQPFVQAISGPLPQTKLGLRHCTSVHNIFSAMPQTKVGSRHWIFMQTISNQPVYLHLMCARRKFHNKVCTKAPLPQTDLPQTKLGLRQVGLRQCLKPTCASTFNVCMKEIP